ncbi:MAG: peptide-methionine (R)-S-oxide reductase [Candidatus Berkelbacteria bacterium Gr01-1014_85]|uniref:peptide-methionine (R)-S-oxide reductase n=1 Tax=Candidatus Berkelbacteria bacterium Gr01-1014_85 TaxID=2017150 RepID=A0A554JDN7_9BACT|nr:MAG: peptide-methionine (R)-S-oxide reductase [Candidatus Berkelbacteria bacterium Gr01-1014_85]
MKTDQEWQQELTPEQYQVLRQKATELPGSGHYYLTKDPGEYRCAGCGLLLFSSDNKYDSGSGWPAFDRPADPESIKAITDDSHGLIRTEITCRRCGGHLGHVFTDGPTETTGLRYCINSRALNFKPKD